MSKTYLWLHNIEKDFYKLVQLLRETFTTTPAQHVTTSDLQVLWGLKHGMDGWLLVTHTIFLSSLSARLKFAIACSQIKFPRTPFMKRWTKENRLPLTINIFLLVWQTISANFNESV